MKKMSPGRRTALIGGLAVAGAAMSPPLAALSLHLVALHTLGQMLLLTLAGPLLVYAARGGPWGRKLDAIHPLVGMLAFNLVLFLGQLPAVINTEAHQPAEALLAQVAALVAAITFWAPVLRPENAGGLRPIARIGYLLVAGCPPTIPGVVLAFSHHAYYAEAVGQGPRPFGLTAIDDQQLAGLILFGTIKLVLVSFTFALLWKMLGEEAEPPDDRRDDSSAPAEPPARPAWLLRIDEELPAEPVPVRSAARGRPSAMRVPGSAPPLPAGEPAVPGHGSRPR
jgi:putative membrane protein